MNKAQLYVESNGSQKRDAFFALKKYFHLINWRTNGGDCILDIGCGSGDLTAYLVNCKIPSSANWLLGIDLSENMVQFARKNHVHPKLDFQQLNIVDLPRDNMIEQFDHILSFYCMHWIQNQRVAFQNVYDLLRPSGDIFMIFLANNPVFEMYENIAKMPKWKQYMYDKYEYISPYQHCQNPEKQLQNLLKDLTFMDVVCRTHPRCYYYEDIESWTKFLISVNPFIDRIPDSLKKEFLEEYTNQMEMMNLIEKTEDGKKFTLHYDIIFVYARKN